MNGFWGEGQSVHLLMFKFSIHLLHPMPSVLYLRATRSMKTLREVEYMPYLPPWSCLQLGVWSIRPPSFMNTWLPFWWGDDYSVVMGWLQCSLLFSLLRLAIQCIQGAHSSIGHYASASPPMDLVRVETNLTPECNDNVR